MPEMHIMSNFLLAAVTLGATSVAHAGSVDANLKTDLERIAQKRIFFGHQSVGMNLLDGVTQLSRTAGIPVRITEVQAAGSTQPGTIGHAFVAENKDPLRKLKSFEEAMGPQPTQIDIALVKFCYVDINANTDTKALFSAYQTTIDKLHARNPATTFLHMTVPLTVVDNGLKARVKRMLGRTPYEDIENARRAEFNTLLRQTYQGKQPIFDLARVESTAPDGKPETVKLDGKAVPVLVPGYSDDGGHLNEIGKQLAARELISVLASIPDRKAAR